jgi:hypothetical protein
LNERTRKDQIESLDSGIRPVGKNALGRQVRASKEQRGRIDNLIQLFRFPDGIHEFHTWLHQINDDADCSAATAQWRPTLSASRRTLWSPTRPTALITTWLGAIRPADRLMGRRILLVYKKREGVRGECWEPARHATTSVLT